MINSYIERISVVFCENWIWRLADGVHAVFSGWFLFKIAAPFGKKSPHNTFYCIMQAVFMQALRRALGVSDSAAHLACRSSCPDPCSWPLTFHGSVRLLCTMALLSFVKSKVKPAICRKYSANHSLTVCCLQPAHYRMHSCTGMECLQSCSVSGF